MNENNNSFGQWEQKPAKETAATRWRKLLEQQRQSGLGVSAYCRERGLSAASMFAWKRRLRPGGERPVAQAFKPVKVVPETLGPSTEQSEPSDLPAIELRLRDGHHLMVRRGFDRQLLLEVIEALEHRLCTMEARS
jgi:hypothetical protein